MPIRQSIALSLVLPCALAAPLVCQQTATSAPHRSTSAERDLTATLRPILEESGVPALGAALLDSESLLAIGVCGKRIAGRDKDASESDLWHLGSCTKAMTATLTLQLAQSDKSFSLNSKLADRLSADLRRRIDAGWRNSTLLDLLQNRGGAPGELPPELWRSFWKKDAGSPQAQRLRLARQLLKTPPAHEPGKSYEYSNAGYALVGHALERSRNETFEKLLQKHVFAPLDIVSAGFGAPGTRGKIDQPRGHQFVDGAYKPVTPGPSADNPPVIAPAARVHMSLRDWARFVRLHLRAARGLDTPGFPPADVIQQLHQPGLERYAAGWIVVDRTWAKGTTLTHSGTNTMWYAVVWLAPQRDAALLVVCNAAGKRAAEACDEAVAALLPRIVRDGGRDR